MGWSLNKIASDVSVILGDRFVNINTTSYSNSSVEIVFKDKITPEEEDKIVGLFPDWIRVQFIWRKG